jgi:crooked neck
VAAAADRQGVLQEVDLRTPFASSSGGAGTASQAALHTALSRTRDAYERAIAQVPLSSEKRFWRRYIYLWICYALFEELTVKDRERARQVYKACLAVVPHKKFTFTKIWLQAAFLEVRCKDLASARKLLGQALGVCAQFNHAKPSIFKGYVSLELQLGEVERCRSIYNKFLEVMPAHCAAWKEYSALEARVGESSRSRAIYELGVSQPELDAPEGLWKAYIDFEVGEGEPQRVRGLYERLLARAPHVKVWIAYALFEAGLSGSAKYDQYARWATVLSGNFTKRIPFESLIEPENYISKTLDYDYQNNYK